MKSFIMNKLEVQRIVAAAATTTLPEPPAAVLALVPAPAPVPVPVRAPTPAFVKPGPIDFVMEISEMMDSADRPIPHTPMDMAESRLAYKTAPKQMARLTCAILAELEKIRTASVSKGFPVPRRDMAVGMAVFFDTKVETWKTRISKRLPVIRKQSGWHTKTKRAADDDDDEAQRPSKVARTEVSQ